MGNGFAMAQWLVLTISRVLDIKARRSRVAGVRSREGSGTPLFDKIGVRIGRHDPSLESRRLPTAKSELRRHQGIRSRGVKGGPERRQETDDAKKGEPRIRERLPVG